MRDHGALREILSQRTSDRFAGKPMEAVASQSFFPELVGEWQPGRIFRHCAMKGGIEAGDVGRIGKVAHRLPKHVERGRQVQGSKHDCFFELTQDLRRDSLMLPQVWAAVHYAMPNNLRSRK